MSIVQISLIILLAVNISRQTSETVAESLRDNIKHVRLDKDQIRKYNSTDHLLIECPVGQLASERSVSKRLQPTNRRAAVITSWFKDGIKLNQYDFEEYGRVRLFQRILKIKNLLPSDSGVYHCEIISGSGINVRSSSLTISVQGSDYQIDSDQVDESTVDMDNYVKGESPLFRNSVTQTIFKSQELTEVSFDCSSTGIPSPEVQWLKDGNIISEEDLMIRDIMQLDLKNLQVSDSGVYTCQVSNQFGKISRDFKLTVLESLRFTENDHLNQTVSLGMEAIFKCGVEPNYNQFGETSISWYIHSSDDSPLPSKVLSQISKTSPVLQINGESYLKLEFKANPVHSMLTGKANIGYYRRLPDNSLYINQVDLSNSRSYLCFANNSRGFNYIKYSLDVVHHSRPQSVDPLVNLFQNAAIKDSYLPSNDIILSMPVVAIIVTASLAVVLFVGLLLCYKSI